MVDGGTFFELQIGAEYSDFVFFGVKLSQRSVS
jgi:hypothetical protein